MTTLNDIIKNIIIVYNHKCSRDCKIYITIQIEHFVLSRIRGTTGVIKIQNKQTKQTKQTNKQAKAEKHLN